MPRTLAIAKRVSLEGYYDWDDRAYALVSPATYGDKLEMSRLLQAKPDNETALKYELATVKSHLLGGEIYIQDENNPSERVLSPLEASDLDEMVDVTQHLFIELSGLDASPKDTQTQTATSSMPQHSSEPQVSESTTKTQ